MNYKMSENRDVSIQNFTFLDLKSNSKDTLFNVT